MEAKLFCGVLYQNKEQCEQVILELTKRFGEIETIGEEYDFDFTDYYLEEFGPGLKKRFIVFRDLIDRKDLPKFKTITCKIEKRFSKDQKRTVNIDSSYITQHSVVVASTKEMPHRVYLDKGIFADIQLVLTKKQAYTYRHTFPDYEKKKGFFLGQREMH